MSQLDPRLTNLLVQGLLGESGIRLPRVRGILEESSDVHHQIVPTFPVLRDTHPLAVRPRGWWTGGVVSNNVETRRVSQSPRLTIEDFTSAATPTSVQIENISAGTEYYFSDVYLWHNNAAAQLIRLRDSMTDAGSIAIWARVGATPATPFALRFRSPRPVTALRFDAADQAASTLYTLVLAGFSQFISDTPTG